MSHDITRRDLFRFSGAAASALALSSCSLLSTDPDKKPQGPVAGAKVKESPMLAKRVDAGTLPPLDQRLPKDPMVVEPLNGPGTFGGTLQRAQIDRNFSSNQYMSWAGLVEWTATTPPQPGPGLAAKWDIEDGGKTFVFHLREGLKWSDGKPFSADDLMFTYEHVYKNKDLTPVFPVWLSPGGKPGKFVKTDDNTLRMEFEAPAGLLLKYLCFMGVSGTLLHPKHYLSKFHKSFVKPDQLKKLMKKYGATTWQDLYNGRRDAWRNPDLPGMGPWQVTSPMTGKGNTAKLERNPFYWRVDQAGRQLPYIDGAIFTALPGDSLALRASSGKIDLAAWDIESSATPLLVQHEDSEPYKVLRWIPDGGSAAVNLNQSHPDPVLRKLFNNIDFRAGLSHAINRDEMNTALLAGQGRKLQPCAQPEDEYWEDGMGKTFIEFDTDEANKRLDAAGLTKRGSDNMRLRPDGKPMKLVALTFEVGVGVPMVDALEYVRRYWKAVGINLAIKSISNTLWYQQMPQGKYDIAGYPPAGYLWDIDSLWYIPTNPLTYWAPRYGAWYVDPKGKFAAKPSGDIRKLQVLYDKLVVSTSDDERLDLGHQILRLHDKNVWIIGTISPPFYPVVVSDDLRNVRQKAVASYRQHYEDATDMTQIYFDHPGKHD